jgi:hypothetical protein
MSMERPQTGDDGCDVHGEYPGIDLDVLESILSRQPDSRRRNVWIRSQCQT